VVYSFRALSGRLKFTVRRHKFTKDSLFFGLALWQAIWPHHQIDCQRDQASSAPACQLEGCDLAAAGELGAHRPDERLLQLACQHEARPRSSLIRYRHETDKSDNRSYRAPTDKTGNDITQPYLRGGTWRSLASWARIVRTSASSNSLLASFVPRMTDLYNTCGMST